MKLQNLIKSIFLVSIFVTAFVACDTDAENIEIQKPYTYDETYYANLREYKKSDHPISYMWFADYTADYSVGLRFIGLPDSLDICSLWAGIPNPEGSLAEAYNEMCWVRETKGTRFVMCTFPSVDNLDWVMELPAEERIKAYGDHILRSIYDNNLDGVDFDYEIQGDWMFGKNMVKLIEYMGQYIGPKGKDPSKLLIVDGLTLEGGYDYLSYFVEQAYNRTAASTLQSDYQDHAAKGLPPERYIVTETLGDNYANGGVAFTEADGNTESAYGGQLYSLEGMARWNPTQGRKGGFGAFYGQRDYNSNPPYKYFRRAIQCCNPPMK